MPRNYVRCAEEVNVRPRSSPDTSLGLLWLGSLIATSALLTTLYTCITPFTALAAIFVTTLSRRQAMSSMAAVWITNQIVGFGVLNYPRTTETFAWGIAICAAALLGTLAADITVCRLASWRSSAQTIAGFVSAFMLYEAALYAFAASVVGGAGAFGPRIIGQVLLVNTVMLVALLALRQLVSRVLVIVRRRPRADAVPARFA
jgi:hypothetical protein